MMHVLAFFFFYFSLSSLLKGGRDHVFGTGVWMGVKKARSINEDIYLCNNGFYLAKTGVSSSSWHNVSHLPVCKTNLI